MSTCNAAILVHACYVIILHKPNDLFSSVIKMANKCRPVLLLVYYNTFQKHCSIIALNPLKDISIRVKCHINNNNNIIIIISR